MFAGEFITPNAENNQYFFSCDYHNAIVRGPLYRTELLPISPNPPAARLSPQFVLERPGDLLRLGGHFVIVGGGTALGRGPARESADKRVRFEFVEDRSADWEAGVDDAE